MEFFGMIVGVIVGVIVRRGAECRMIKTKTKKTASAYSPTIKPLKTAYRSQWQGRYCPDTDFCYPWLAATRSKLAVIRSNLLWP